MQQYLNRLRLSLFITLCVVAGFLSLGTSPVCAYTLITREAMAVDEKMSDQRELQYKEPQKILITQVKSVAEELTYDGQVWVESLYYYSITRLGFGDVPYNYLIDRDGVIYQGRQGYTGVVPELQEPEGVVIIGYLSNGADISLLANNTLGEFITDLSKQFAIPASAVQTVELAIAPDHDNDNLSDQTQLSKTEYKEINNTFATNVKSTVARATFFTSKNPRSYIGKIENLEYPEEVKMGDEITVSMELVNESDFPWFTDSDWIWLRTENKKDSEFAVNGVWDSFSTPTHIEDLTILPLESESIDILLSVKRTPQKDVSTKLQFFLEGNKRIAGTQFDVTFDIVKGDKDLLRIDSSSAGYLNVHDCASIYCDTIAKVNDAEIFVFTEEKRGFYLITYDGEEKGWVYGKYTEKL